MGKIQRSVMCGRRAAAAAPWARRIIGRSRSRPAVKKPLARTGLSTAKTKIVDKGKGDRAPGSDLAALPRGGSG